MDETLLLFYQVKLLLFSRESGGFEESSTASGEGEGVLANIISAARTEVSVSASQREQSRRSRLCLSWSEVERLDLQAGEKFVHLHSNATRQSMCDGPFSPCSSSASIENMPKTFLCFCTGIISQ